jgi:hypothetical protein
MIVNKMKNGNKSQKRYIGLKKLLLNWQMININKAYKINQKILLFKI